MKKIIRKGISFILAAAMVVTMIPATALQAETQQQPDLKNQMRTAVSDQEYPNGLLGFGKTQITVTEKEQKKITVVRQGNTDKEATVKFKAVDVSATYASDYLLTVVHSAIRKEQLEKKGDSKSLLEQNASPGTTGTEVVVPEETTIEAEETQKEKKAVQKEAKGGLRAAYQIQNQEAAPSNDWKETNPEAVPEEISSAMEEGKESTQDFMKQVSGVSTTLTFAPGEYQKEIILETLDNNQAESEEQIAFFLYDAEGTEIGADHTGYANIKDDEETEEVIFAVKNRNISVDADEDTAKVTIVRKSGIEQMAFVTVGTKGVTALAGRDYEAVQEDLLFPAGVREKTVEIPIMGDRSEDRGFYVGISEDGVVREKGKEATQVTIKKQEESQTLRMVKSANGRSKSARASAKTKNITITNKGQIGSGGAFVASGINLQFADRITIKYEVKGASSTTKCNKRTWHYDKNIQINITNANGQNVETFSEDKLGKEKYEGTKTFSRSMFSNDREFTRWDSLDRAKIWVKAEGRNGNTSASIQIQSIEVNYPGVTFQINNEAPVNYYTEKQYTSASAYTGKNQLLLGKLYFGNNQNTITTVLHEEGKLDVRNRFSGVKNSQGVAANSNTVQFKGYRFQLPNAQNKYSEVLSNYTMTKSFLNKYRKYMYGGGSFTLIPVFEVKTAGITFNNDQAQVGKTANAKGEFKGYKAGSSLRNIAKLDTIHIKASANSGYAINAITLQSNRYTVSNAKENNDKTSLICGLGDNGDSAYTARISYEDASIKVMADPSFRETEEIKKGTVLYTDENDNVTIGNAQDPLWIKNIFMNRTYNIIGLAEDGYRPVWRDGTLDYNEDGVIENIAVSYKPFTPVRGSVLPYTTQTATGRVYYSFEHQQPVGKPADIFGWITLRDRYLLTGEEVEKGLNGANITADGKQVQTETGGTNKKNQREGFFRISSNTFSVVDYYLINVNAYGEEGDVNTAFVMNPGAVKECVIDTADDLTITNPVISVQDKESGEYVPQTITRDDYGYYSALTNGDKNYRLEMRADKAGISITKGKLQFYDADGKYVKELEGTPVGDHNDGHFAFDFNPKNLELSAGTTLRVKFTDSQGHTYLQREVGMSLSQAIGNLEVANSFTFGGANTIVELIGKVDSAFNMGWNGDFDDTLGDNVSNDTKTGDKIISVGFAKNVVNNEDNRSTIEKAAEEMAKKEQDVADANKALAKKSSELAKKDQKDWTQDDLDEMEELKTQVETAYQDRETQSQKYEQKVRDAQTPKSVETTVASGVNLDFSFGFIMTFGKDDKSQYYFKSMVLNAEITGGANATVKFSTPIGISVNLGFAGGGTGDATFVVEERKDMLHPKKYYIQDLTVEDESGANKINVFDCNMKNADRKFDGYGSFSLKPYINLSVGAGVLADLIEVSISGAANFNMQFFTTADENNGNVNLSSALSVKVLMLEHSWTIASVDVNLFGNSTKARSLLNLEDENYLYDSADTLQAEDLGYMRGGTRWGTRRGLRSLDENKGAYSETQIGDKIAENPDFKMISLGNGEYLAVFTNVDPKRTAVNAKAVYYTLYSNGAWSTPKMIEDDGTLDQYPAIADLGNRGAVITWSSAEQVFTEETSRIAMQNDLNLHCVFFDKTRKRMSEVQEVTRKTTDSCEDPNYNYSDYSADVAANISYNDDKMIIYYQKKEYSAGTTEYLGDVLFPEVSVMAARTYDFNGSNGTEGTWETYTQAELTELENALKAEGLTAEQSKERAEAYQECFYGQDMFSFLPAVRIEEKLDSEGYWEKGSQTEVKEIESSSALIIDTDAMSYNDLGVFAYTVDLDGNLDTSGDRDLYMQIYDFKTDSFKHPVVITSDSVEDQRIQFVRTKGETYLSWIHAGNIVALNMSNIIHNYDRLLLEGQTKDGDGYYYLNKARVENGVGYDPWFTVVEGEVAAGDESVSAITDFDVEASDDYVYFMWTQMDNSLKDGVKEGTVEADDPANANIEKQMYTVRYDVRKERATKPVQITSGKGANYNDVTFAVEGDQLTGLVYRAESKTVTLDEYNQMIEENNANVEKQKARAQKNDPVQGNEPMETLNDCEYVPFAVADKENAAPYAFRVNPKGEIKIKNAKLDGGKAGQDATLTFDLLNDGVETLSDLTITATNQNGNDILFTTGQKEEDVLPAAKINIAELWGGESLSESGSMAIEENAKAVKATITVKDKSGKVLAQEVVSETLESKVHIADLKAEPTSQRNQYQITGTIVNDGSATAPAGKVPLGTQKGEKLTPCGSVDYPMLLPGDSSTFTRTITVKPENTFVEETDEVGNLTETGTIYVKSSDELAQTVIRREAYAEEIDKVKAIKAAGLDGVTGDELIIKRGESVVLSPVVSSALADEANGITGMEGLQYKLVSDKEDIVSINEQGIAQTSAAGNAKVTLYIYPQDRMFRATNHSQGSDIKNVLGTNEDAYLTVPEKAIYQKEFAVKVSATQDTTVTPGEDTPPDTNGQETGKRFTKKGYQYKITSAKTVTFMGVNNKKAKKVTIPSQVKFNGVTYKVTSIGKKALAGNRRLRTVIIGKNVTKISRSAFAGCRSLRTILVRTTKLKKINKKAFANIHRRAVFRLYGTKKQKRRTRKLFTAKTGFRKQTMRIKY